MGVIEGRTWLELLSPRACQELVAGERVGRLGVIVGRYPEIFPLNFAVDGDSVVFRSDRGTKLAALREHAEVAFEVDGVDRTDRSGWSVLILGEVRHVSDPGELGRLRALPLEPWAHGDKDHWVRIVPHQVTGRRLHRSPATV